MSHLLTATKSRIDAAKHTNSMDSIQIFEPLPSSGRRIGILICWTDGDFDVFC